MHLIVLEHEPSSFLGGQELSLLDVCRGLYERGHSISLLYVKSGNLLEQYREFCTHVLNVNSYLIERSTLITSVFNFLTDIWKIYWEIPKTENSIVYCNQHYDTPFGSTLAIVKNISFVCHLRQPPPEKIHRQCVIAMSSVKEFITISNRTKLDWIKSGFRKEKN